MCTLTWFCEEDTYHVFFNRDEQRSRIKALPPTIFEESNGRYVMPIDPQGGGTWITSNEYGLTLALLNFYQGKTPSGALVSRGTIVQMLAMSKSYSQVLLTLRALDLSRYAPFTLTIFCPEVLADHERVGIARWDGEKLHDYTSAGPLISSGVNFESVSKARLQSFRELLIKSNGAVKERVNDEFARHIKYHRGHEPEKSALSVCMHRSDAHTVSFSQLSINKSESVFRYADGSPCEHECEYQVSLRLKTKGEKGLCRSISSK